jgi:hypothetical protein
MIIDMRYINQGHNFTAAIHHDIPTPKPAGGFQIACCETVNRKFIFPDVLKTYPMKFNDTYRIKTALVLLSGKTLLGQVADRIIGV